MNGDTFSRCIELVAHSHGMTLGELCQQTHRRAVARPRQIAMWLARQHTDWSLPKIASALGLTHHTTVLHGVRRVERLRSTDLTVYALTEHLSGQVTA